LGKVKTPAKSDDEEFGKGEDPRQTGRRGVWEGRRPPPNWTTRSLGMVKTPGKSDDEEFGKGLHQGGSAQCQDLISHRV